MTENEFDTMDELDDLSELESMYGNAQTEMEAAEKVELSQNLEGFASCFPDWDLHPPVKH